MKHVYIAGPFFNQYQKGVIKDIESVLEYIGFKYYSPMQHGRGNLKEMSLTERELIARDIFMDNCDEVAKADIIIAITDDFDPGTMFELGYAHSYSKIILTYSSKEYGSNVMISQAVTAHYTSLDLLKRDFVLGIFIGELRKTIS